MHWIMLAQQAILPWSINYHIVCTNIGCIVVVTIHALHKNIEIGWNKYTENALLIIIYLIISKLCAVFKTPGRLLGCC